MKGPERRKHKRQELACPMAMSDRAGQCVARGRTANISDGGALVPIVSGDTPGEGQVVEVRFSVPRSTPNTFLYEEFTSPARVVRRKRRSRSRPACIAIQFHKPLELDLEP